ncbi:MAG: hypothetical protein P1V13_03350 [Rhizobiaceae bacterium]|nr:hypothetical protein [Rhizobiaceae bacterium]
METQFFLFVLILFQRSLKYQNSIAEQEILENMTMDTYWSLLNQPSQPMPPTRSLPSNILATGRSNGGEATAKHAARLDRAYPPIILNKAAELNARGRGLGSSAHTDAFSSVRDRQKSGSPNERILNRDEACFAACCIFDGIGVLLFAGGANGLILPTRGQAEGVTAAALGLFGTGWAIGNVAGCL